MAWEQAQQISLEVNSHMQRRDALTPSLRQKATPQELMSGKIESTISASQGTKNQASTSGKDLSSMKAYPGVVHSRAGVGMFFSMLTHLSEPSDRLQGEGVLGPLCRQSEMYSQGEQVSLASIVKEEPPAAHIRPGRDDELYGHMRAFLPKQTSGLDRLHHRLGLTSTNKDEAQVRAEGIPDAKGTIVYICGLA